jgi:hypothetical protein
MKSLLQNHLDRFKHLPDPSVELRKVEFHERIQAMFGTARRHGIVRQAGELEQANGNYCAVWTTDRDAYVHVQRLLDARDDTSPPALPCGDHGFVNAGGEIACKFDDCAGAWSKSELQHYWEHGELPTNRGDTTGAIVDA